MSPTSFEIPKGGHAFIQWRPRWARGRFALGGAWCCAMCTRRRRRWRLGRLCDANPYNLEHRTPFDR